MLCKQRGIGAGVGGGRYRVCKRPENVLYYRIIDVRRERSLIPVRTDRRRIPRIKGDFLRNGNGCKKTEGAISGFPVRQKMASLLFRGVSGRTGFGATFFPPASFRILTHCVSVRPFVFSPASTVRFQIIKNGKSKKNGGIMRVPDGYKATGR